MVVLEVANAFISKSIYFIQALSNLDLDDNPRKVEYLYLYNMQLVDQLVDYLKGRRVIVDIKTLSLDL